MTEPADNGPNPLSSFVAVIVAVVAVIAAVAYLGLRDDDGDAAPGTIAQSSASATPTDAATATAQPTEAAPAAGAVTVGSCTYNPDGSASKPVTPPTEADLRDGTVTATLTMNIGTVVLSLDGAKAPCATTSFVSLARQGFYNDTTCHRILSVTPPDTAAFAQCGDPTGTGTGGAGYQYAEENLDGATYPRGTVAMAKTQAPGSTGSQFFLVTGDFQLQPEYTVLGTITSGLEALDTALAKGTQPGTEMPLEPIDITSVTTSG